MQLRRNAIKSLEALIMGVYFVQTVRYLYAALYADISSADLVRRLPSTDGITDPGVVDPTLVRAEVLATVAVFLTPLLAIILARSRWSLPLAVAVTVIARYLTIELPESSVVAAAVTVGGGLLYLTVLAVRRPRWLPTMLATGFAGDIVIRAWNNTLDPTFDAGYEFALFGQTVTMSAFAFGVAIAALIITALAAIIEREEERLPGHTPQPPGILTGWGALALGGILFLEFTILGLPNAVARWADTPYEIVLPMMLLATILPLVPEARAQAGNFLSMFDGVYRGWLWALMLALFIVVGRRFDGLTAAVVLALAQFLAILTLWWLVRQPKSFPKRSRWNPFAINPTPIFVLISALVFGILAVGDYFTYDYAFVRPLAAPFGFVSDILSGMQGLGMVLALVAVVFACLPMILERQIIPWRQGKVIETLFLSAMAILLIVSATGAAAPAPIQRPLDPNCLRVATWNIHSGYTQFFAPNLEQLAESITRSGADVVLLQEVDTGRMTSGGVDQALWLANRLNMNQTFFAQNEETQGLAILSRLDVSSDEGALLTSEGAQAAVQYVTYSLDQSGDLHVYNVWFGFQVAERNGIPLTFEQQDQTIQQDEVYRLIANNHFSPDAAERQDRVVLGGTFNYDEDSPLYTEWAETILLDPFTSLFDERRDTLFTIDGISARFDYLWLLNLVPSGANIAQTYDASDHRPSIAAVGREAGQSCPQNN